ncbi:MAG TPA: DinB family protein [Vicinamibacterales bacterium]|nr:DinB family protein [Vicinamibacterales bacterium]
MSSQPEYWLRGPVDGVPALVMPAAHALLQTLEDVERVVTELTVDQVWSTPGGAASVGYHVRHLAGSTDRLFTYARGERLSEDQKRQLSEEPSPSREEPAALLHRVRGVIERGIAQIRATPAESLTDARTVGRAALPTNVLGLIFHAAEHSQRHAGQIVTTARIVRGLS